MKQRRPAMLPQLEIDTIAEKYGIKRMPADHRLNKELPCIEFRFRLGPPIARGILVPPERMKLPLRILKVPSISFTRFESSEQYLQE